MLKSFHSSKFYIHGNYDTGDPTTKHTIIPNQDGFDTDEGDALVSQSRMQRELEHETGIN